MRIMKAALLALLTLPILGIGTLSARQQVQPRKDVANGDAYVTREVRHELMLVPWYTVFDNLQYSVKGDEVTLSGQVTQPTVKSDAENAVKQIQGVRKVDDQIEILPLSEMD